MGGYRTTTQNLEVVRIDTSLDLVFVKGCVPGVDDAHVMVRDAKKKMREIVRANFAKGKDAGQDPPQGRGCPPIPRWHKRDGGWLTAHYLSTQQTRYKPDYLREIFNLYEQIYTDAFTT